MKIVIPEPLPTLNKIYARHWRTYQKMMHDWKELIHLSLLAQKIPREQLPQPVTITVTVYQGQKRKRDADNVALKPLLDSVVDYGLLEDDNWTIVKSITTSIDYDKENPRTEVEILEVSDK